MQNPNIIVNMRCLLSPITGVQRYTTEIVEKFPKESYETISPKITKYFFYGHLWEQLILPGKVKDKLLWSPANTGPLSVKQQVLSILDLSTIDHPEWFSPKYSSWYRILLPNLAKRSKHILTISEFSKRRIMEQFGISDEKITVTYLAADKKFQPQSQNIVVETRKEFKLPEHYFLALSSLEPRKNLEKLLKTWGNIETKLPQDIWLVVAGGKGKSSVFKELAFKQLPKRIIFTGYVPEKSLPGLYSGALGFIYLSVYEGFGLPPIEAMACGVPVITSNSTSLPEVVGDSSLLVNPLNEEEIGHAIQSLAENSSLGQELRQKGLERAQLFAWERTAAKTWQVLDRMAEQN